MNDHTKQIKIYNNTTGEVVFDEEEQMKFYPFTDKGYLLHNNHSAGVKVMHRIEWPITTLEKSKWMTLLPYIDKNNALMRHDRPTKPLTVKLITPIIELSEKKVYVWMKRMLDTNVIRKDDGFFYVNPMFIMASNRMSPELYRIFKDQVEGHIPDWVPKRYKELNE